MQASRGRGCWRCPASALADNYVWERAGRSKEGVDLCCGPIVGRGRRASGSTAPADRRIAHSVASPGRRRPSPRGRAVRGGAPRLWSGAERERGSAVSPRRQLMRRASRSGAWSARTASGPGTAGRHPVRREMPPSGPRSPGTRARRERESIVAHGRAQPGDGGWGGPASPGCSRLGVSGSGAVATRTDAGGTGRSRFTRS